MTAPAGDPPIVTRFPKPPSLVRSAYRALDLAAVAVMDDPSRLSGHADLPRPWIPASCDGDLRREVWAWLDRVVIWVNHEYVFDPNHAIPACWPQHPHLAHEIAVLAELRHRAELALTCDALERWHSFALPQFTDRMRARVGEACETGHPNAWPAGARFARHGEGQIQAERDATFDRDVTILGNERRSR